jgi:uncharacterized membrane protein YphA (DoxX/SURF4 family)
VHVSAAKMFLQVLLTRETIPCTAVAVGVWTHQWLFGIDVLFVNFALVSQKPTRVCESLNLVTPWFQTLVGTVMFIHVFATGDVALALDRRVRI